MPQKVNNIETRKSISNRPAPECKVICVEVIASFFLENGMNGVFCLSTSWVISIIMFLELNHFRAQSSFFAIKHLSTCQCSAIIKVWWIVGQGRMSDAAFEVDQSRISAKPWLNEATGPLIRAIVIISFRCHQSWAKINEADRFSRVNIIELKWEAKWESVKYLCTSQTSKVNDSFTLNWLTYEP